MLVRCLALFLCVGLLGMTRPCACQNKTSNKAVATCCKAKHPSPSPDRKPCCQVNAACAAASAFTPTSAETGNSPDSALFAIVPRSLVISTSQWMASAAADPHAPPPLAPTTLFHLACLLSN